MKKLFALWAACLLFAAPVRAATKPEIVPTTAQGVVSGFDCAVYRIECPVTHRGFDMATPGILTDKGDWFFVVNVPPSFLNQYFLEKLEVSGDVYKPYIHAIEPKSIHLVKEGQKQAVFEKGQFVDANGHRSTFAQGHFNGESWVCMKCAKAEK